MNSEHIATKFQIQKITQYFFTITLTVHDAPLYLSWGSFTNGGHINTDVFGNLQIGWRGTGRDGDGSRILVETAL